MEHRLNASARFLGYGCRLTLINSVISSLPAYYVWTVHKTITKNFDRIRSHCLWDKIKDRDSPSVNALTAWSLVCRPKHHCGLGILNIELRNKALLLKQLHKFYEKENTPWVSLVWSMYENGAPHAQSKSWGRSGGETSSVSWTSTAALLKVLLAMVKIHCFRRIFWGHDDLRKICSLIFICSGGGRDSL